VTALGRWFRPPRHVLTLFLGVTGSLSLAMGWLGWQLVAPDRALASQRRQERLDNAGETAVASLRKGLEDLAQRLELLSKLPAAAAPAAFAGQASTLGGGAALILADDRAFDAWPAGILLYYPHSALGRSTLAATRAGDRVSGKRWRFENDGTYTGTVAVDVMEGPTTRFRIPADAGPGDTIHIIAEGNDDGALPLTRHARAVVTVE
jgi:hypothetical protein